MLTIKISDAVAAAIAERGKFGETHDDVLRRVFGLASTHRTEPLIPGPGARGRGKTRHAEKRLSNDMIRGGRLRIELEGTPVGDWKLPDKSDKAAIKRVRDVACAYAREHGATRGQTNAIGKALQQAGFYVRGPKKGRLTAAELDI